ncbi:Glutathione-disulfide reductase, partial [human gut metagenome]
LVEEMKKSGPTLHTHKIPERLEKLENGAIRITFEDRTSHTVQHVIWATGRTADTNGQGRSSARFRERVMFPIRDKRGRVV